MITQAVYVPSGMRPVRSIWSHNPWSRFDDPAISMIDVRTVGARV
jgi:hypothetical protein